MKTSDEIDNRLNAILEGYTQRSTLRDSLQTCDKGDYGKDSEKGRLLTSILTQMEAVELKTLTSIAKLPMLFEPLCEKQGIAVNRLDVIRFFRPHQVIEQALSSCETAPRTFFELRCHRYDVLIQRGNEQGTELGKPLGLRDVRHFVEFDGILYDVVGVIESLVRMWGLVLESNLDCSEHLFVNQTSDFKVAIWASPGFYETAMKILSQKITKGQSQKKTTELAVVKGDIEQRLERIDVYFRERYELRGAIRKLCRSDGRKKTGEYQRVKVKANLAEDNLLHELYHLGDNMRKYLRLCDRIEDMKVVDNFLPYRWCGEYVNQLKHGSRGRNRASAVQEYFIEFYDRNGPKPSVGGKLIDFAFQINIDGRLETCMEISQKLIDLWCLFLRYHSDIDFTSFTVGINDIIRNEFVGKSVYSGKIPDGILDEAKRKARERRTLNL
ncbi:MAG: hypothetical protein ACYTEQ_22640 [Planctomycetota bacterium]|jgi:hypothetical protein